MGTGGLGWVARVRAFAERVVLPCVCARAAGGARVRACGLWGAAVSCDPTPAMQVAIKRIPQVLREASDAKRILREIYILRRVAHPNIVRLLDITAADYKSAAGGEQWDIYLVSVAPWPRRRVVPDGGAPA